MGVSYYSPYISTFGWYKSNLSPWDSFAVRGTTLDRNPVDAEGEAQ